VKVIVVGGGIIGCCIAFHLQKAGATVTLLERGEIGGEASGAAAGMLIAPIEDAGNRVFDELLRASLSVYPVLIEEVQRLSRVDVEYKRQGMLRTAVTEDFARHLQRLARKRDLEWVDGADLHRLEPALDRAVLGAAYSETDADLNPGQMTNALAKAAEKLGAKVRRRTMLTGFRGRERRVEGVSTNEGDIRDTDAIVLAAGPWTEPLSLRLSSRLPTPPMRGQMIAFRSRVLRHTVWGEHGYLVPKPRGLIFAGSTVEDVGFRKTTTARALAGLRRMATDLAPALATAGVTRNWAGLRPGSPDGLPVIGRVPGKDNVYVATGHFRNGILLAPVTGRLVADLVLSGKPDRRLKPFLPERFLAK
jgi:glycine oxidase